MQSQKAEPGEASRPGPRPGIVNKVYQGSQDRQPRTIRNHSSKAHEGSKGNPGDSRGSMRILEYPEISIDVLGALLPEDC